MKNNTYKITTQEGDIFLHPNILTRCDSSILLECGQAQMFISLCVNKKPDYNSNFLPLTVKYQEKMFSANKIPGSINRREGKPSDRETLISRLIDRSLRPIIDPNFAHEIQIVITLLSFSNQIDIEKLSILGSYIVTKLSNINVLLDVCPIRIVKQTKLDEFCLQYNIDQDYYLNCICVCNDKNIIMIDYQGLSSDEKHIQQAIEIAQYQAKDNITNILNVVDNIILDNQISNKYEYKTDYLDIIQNNFSDKLTQLTYENINTVAQEIIQQDPSLNISIVESNLKKIIKNQILSQIQTFKRQDSRLQDQIRDIVIFPSPIIKAHGSCIFSRGNTKVLAVVTLGSDTKSLDSHCILGSNDKLMLHYNFPSFSVGEIGLYGAPKRREIGHGALALKAIKSVIGPFSNVIRISAEVLCAEGSTSLATISASCLALKDAGIQISEFVAGVSMGIIYTINKYIILTDISEQEDFIGDIDFKIAGTRKGVTAMQMDVKNPYIIWTKDIIKDILHQAKLARIAIIEKMESVNVREYHEFRPVIDNMPIAEKDIRTIIGPNGATIKKISEQSNTSLNIADGMLKIFAPDRESYNNCIKQINKLLYIDKENIFQGGIYNGIVIKETNKGYLVKFNKGTCCGFMLRINKTFNIRDKIRVCIVNIDGDKYLLEEIN